MEKDLKYIKISFCEPNGEAIMGYEIKDSLSALVPNVGDMVNIEGTYRKITERAFLYSPITIIVMIYLKEAEHSKEERYSFE